MCAQTIEKALSTLGGILCGGQGKQSEREKSSKERIHEEGQLLLLPSLQENFDKEPEKYLGRK